MLTAKTVFFPIISLEVLSLPNMTLQFTYTEKEVVFIFLWIFLLSKLFY